MHKQRVGMDGQARGRLAAGVDAAGTSMACCGLAAFATIVWKELPGHGGPEVIAAATVAWLILSVALWWLRKSRLLCRRTNHPRRSPAGADTQQN